MFLKKITIIAYNLKRYFRFHIFTFWISPNLAQYVYELWSNMTKLKEKTIGEYCLSLKEGC
jgi:hypothetical protein